MAKVRGIACAVLFLSFCSVQLARGDELSGLKEQMGVLQRQIEEQARQMGQMQQRIEELEAQRAARIQSPEGVADRITALEERLEQPHKGGLLSLKGARFEIGGELELEFINTQDDAFISEPEPHFQLDKFVLLPKVHLSDNATLEAELEFTQSSVKVVVGTLTFSDLPLDSELKIGLDCRFIAPSRKTEGYPLNGNAFWRDEELGLTWSTKREPFYGILSVSQGLELDSRGVGEDNSYRMLHDNVLVGSYGGVKEVGVGLGFAQELGRLGAVDVLGFGFFNELSDADVAFLKANLSGYTSNDDEQHRAGLNLDYDLGNFNFFTQYIAARDGDLSRYGWYVQPSYKVTLPVKWKYFKTHDFLVRYGRYDVDAPKSFGLPATWDREELMFAVISEVMKNVKLKTEYSINDEKTGSGAARNDELLMQLEVRF